MILARNWISKVIRSFPRHQLGYDHTESECVASFAELVVAKKPRGKVPHGFAPIIRLDCLLVMKVPCKAKVCPEDANCFGARDSRRE